MNKPVTAVEGCLPVNKSLFGKKDYNESNYNSKHLSPNTTIRSSENKALSSLEIKSIHTLPQFSIAQISIFEKMQKQERVHFEKLQKQIHDENLVQLGKIKNEKKGIDQSKESLKQDSFFKTLLSAFSTCTAIASGALMISRGKIYMGGAVILGAIISAAAQAAQLTDSQHTTQLQTLALGASIAHLSFGNGIAHQDNLIKHISTLSIICQSILGARKGIHNSQKLQKEKNLFLNTQEVARFNITMKKILKIIVDIVENITINIEYCVLAAMSQANLMTQLSKQLNKKWG